MDKPLTAGAEHAAQPTFLRAVLHTVERLRARRALRLARRAADAELALRKNPPLRLAWRVEELVSPKNRLDLAHALRSLVRDSSARYLPAASPVNRVAVRGESDAILGLAARLAEIERPVAPRGIVLADRLLTDGAGPLYDRERVDELPAYLDSALHALEPESH